MPDPLTPTSDTELRTHVERILSDTYELDREIGRGGMGIVYKARDKRLKRTVAIKVLPPELSFRGEIRTRFLREAETAAQLSHPNIVPIYSVDERQGLVYFVMAFVDGENLASRLHREGAMTNESVRSILCDVSRALAYAHERGVVHRDIKPDNILLDQDGRVLVTDFGIARAISDGAEARLTATGIAIGTPAYMSPEQSTGDRDVDGRSDLYSLGVVGYQMLVGELPFNSTSTPALLVKHLSEAPTPIEERCPTVAPDLGRAIMLLLEKDPAHRLPSAGSLAVALETQDVPDLPRRTPSAPDGSSRVPARRALTAIEASSGDLGHVTQDEYLRWELPAVQEFRKRATPWAFFGVASVLLSIFGIIDGFMGIWGLWTIFMAWKYAKLWADGYDWRDVMREPKDRMFFDVVSEWADSLRALWDPRKREEVRDRERLRRERMEQLRAGRGFTAINAPAASSPRGQRLVAASASIYGSQADVVAAAARDRDDVIRLLGTLPRKDRDQLGDVAGSAVSLYNKIDSLAVAIAAEERVAPGGSLESVDAEIATLEAAANPLDHKGSEERVRRLAQLKRQRRQFAQAGSGGAERKARLESCALVLQNMRLDLVRLKSGSQTLDHITLIAEEAAALAREVDTALYVKDEMAKLDRRQAGSVRRV